MEKTKTLCQLCDSEVPSCGINDHLFEHIQQTKEKRKLKKKLKKKLKEQQNQRIQSENFDRIMDIRLGLGIQYNGYSPLKINSQTHQGENRKMNPNMVIEYWMLHFLQATGVQELIGGNMLQDLIELFIWRAKPCGFKFTNTTFWQFCGENSNEEYIGHEEKDTYQVVLAPIDQTSITEIYDITGWIKTTNVSIQQYISQLDTWQNKNGWPKQEKCQCKYEYKREIVKYYQNKWWNSGRLKTYFEYRYKKTSCNEIHCKKNVKKYKEKLSKYLQTKIEQRQSVLCIKNILEDNWIIIKNCGQKIDGTQIFCDKCAEMYKFKQCKRKDRLFQMRNSRTTPA